MVLLKIQNVVHRMGPTFQKLVEKSFFWTTIAIAWTHLSLLLYRESWSGLFSNRISVSGDGASTAFYLNQIALADWSEVLKSDVQTEFFGWPNKLKFSQNPSGELVNLIFIKFFANLINVDDGRQLIHIFAILKFPIIAAASYSFFKIMYFSTLKSLILSTIFASASFNLIRSEGHFFLGLTWPIPIGFVLYMAASRIDEGESNDKLNNQIPKKLLLIIGLIIGLSSFYYSLILICIQLIYLMLININLFLHKSKKKFKTRIFEIFLKNKWSLYSLLSIFLGFVSQVISILIANMNSVRFSEIGERSKVESIVYSGSLESVFFDSSKMILSIFKREDIANYLSTRIVWEGSQFGLLGGIICYCIIGILLFNISNVGVFIKKSQSLKNNQQSIIIRKLLTYFLIIFVLYLPTPLNFTISQFIPQIRAWGRVSIFLILIGIALLAKYFDSLERAFLRRICFIILITAQLADAQSFREARIPSSITEASVVRTDNQYKDIFNELYRYVKKECGVMYLPIYPYPEFDYPSDFVGDYAPLELISHDSKYFKWSYPNVKNTEEFFPFQNLQSDLPNFVRSSIGTQIELSKEMGACASIVDRAMLNRKEDLDFSALLDQKKGSCVYGLNGVKFAEKSRYYLINYKNSCFEIIYGKETITGKYVNSDPEIIYSTFTPYATKFIDDWILYPAETEIELKIRTRNSTLNSDKDKSGVIYFGVKLYGEKGETVSVDEVLKLCYFLGNKTLPKCDFGKFDSENDYYLFKLEVPPTGNIKFTIGYYLNAEKTKNWSIRVVEN